MYSTVTFEGNLGADVEVKENKAGGVYLDAVVLVNQGKDSDGTDRTPTRWQVRMTGRTSGRTSLVPGLGLGCVRLGEDDHWDAPGRSAAFDGPTWIWITCCDRPNRADGVPAAGAGSTQRTTSGRSGGSSSWSSQSPSQSGGRDIASRDD